MKKKVISAMYLGPQQREYLMKILGNQIELTWLASRDEGTLKLPRSIIQAMQGGPIVAARKIPSRLRSILS